MKTTMSVALLTGLLGVLGCASLYSNQRLDENHAMRIKPCPSDDIIDPQDHAFTAMLAALAARHWVIERANRSEHEIVAQGCKAGTVGDPLKFSDGKCLIIKFSIWGNGEIIAYNPKDRRMNSDIAVYAEGWMSKLERSYADLRCYSKEELLRRGATDRGS